MMEFPPKISLTAARVNAGFEQKDAARELGITPPTLRSWERGDTLPDIAMVGRIESLYRYPKDFIHFGKRSLLANQ